ncbi:hypothetical protein SDC9_89889 [bioreactor metagenome]|uniref:Uncharacterized protein n=1 Tax=bioreactor metagenome TaxID=1076179 RepID=A0A644ZR30_9ZZZZ
MNKERVVKILAASVAILGIAVKTMQAQLDEKKLEKMVAKEVQKQLNQNE